MKKIILILIFLFFMRIVSYAQDFEKKGGLFIVVSPAATETVKAIGELLVTDPQGKKTGFDPSAGTVLREIPNTSYDKDRIDNLETGESGVESASFEADTPMDGQYKITVIGTSTGKYYLDIDSYDVNFTANVQEIDGATYPGKIDNYEITYSSVPGYHVADKYTGSSSIPVFDGKGQSPEEVNKFLQYLKPTQVRTELPAGTQSFSLSIIYGKTIKYETFAATLNGKNITSQFEPLPGKLEVVSVPLIKGSNTLVLSIKGVKTGGRTAEDTDRIVFIVP